VLKAWAGLIILQLGQAYLILWTEWRHRYVWNA